MRLVLTILLIILNSAPGFGQEAVFFCKQSTYKFPKTKEGVQLEHHFTVVNTGKKPLIISDYKVQCTCTKVYLPKEPIAPGKSAEINVTFDSEGKSYYQDRIIDLTTNTKRKTEKLRFKVYIEPKH